MKYMLKDRMAAIDSTMSDARKKETGWAKLKEQYNAGYAAPADRSNIDKAEGYYFGDESLTRQVNSIKRLDEKNARYRI